MKLRLVFEIEKETKNTVRYQEVENAAGETICGTLYIKKNQFEKGMGFPYRLTVTVEEGDNR